jgi:hypothetical protein
VPYSIRKVNNKWEVYNDESGKVYGRHASKAKARAQQAALYVNAPPDKEEKK